MVVLDGRTGEGGGQLVRIAACLSAITGTPIRVHNVRGNRGRGKKKGGAGGENSRFPMAALFDFGLTKH